MRTGKSAPDYFSLEVNTFATASNICSASYWETGACFSRRKSPVLLQTDIHRRMSSVRLISESVLHTLSIRQTGKYFFSQAFPFWARDSRMRIHISSRILNYGLASTAASSHILVFGPNTCTHTTTPSVAISFMESASESSFCEHIPLQQQNCYAMFRRKAVA